MRLISLVLLSCIYLTQISAQNTLSDTVKIREVSVNSTGVKNNFIQTQVLDSDDLNDPVYKDLGESLQQNANSFVKSYGIGSMATISLRGTNSSQTQLFWNGIKLNSVTYGSNDLALFPNFFIDQAEVDYGLTSLRYGSGGLGGAVRLQSKPHFKKKSKLNVTQDIGSFGQRTSTLKLQMGDEKWQSESKLFYRIADHDFYYENSAKEGKPEEKVRNASLLQRGLMQSFHFRNSENSWFSGHFWYYDSDRNLPPLMTGTAFKEHQEDRSYRSILEYHQYFDRSKLEVKSSYIKDDLRYENNRSKLYSKNTSHSYVSLVDYEIKLSKKWGWSSRLNLNYYQLESSNAFKEEAREEVSSFHSLELKPSSKWKIKVSSRQLLVDNRNYWMPNLSVLFFPDTLKSWCIGTNLGQNIKYPTLNDLYLETGGNENLQEEISQTAEFSLRKQWQSNRSHFKLETATYYSDIENYILWQPTIYGYWQARNINSVLTKGLELRGTFEQQIDKYKLQLKSNYTYTSSIKNERSYLNDASKGKQLIYIPEHQYNLNVSLSWLNYRISYRQQFVSVRYTTTDNREFLPYYSISDLTLSTLLEWKEQQFLISFSALNMLDTQYQSIQWRPMPGRNYLVRLKLMLNS